MQKCLFQIFGLLAVLWPNFTHSDLYFLVIVKLTKYSKFAR